MATHVVFFEDIGKDKSKVGGKGANLGEMVIIGMPVPPGFVVTTDAYDEFVEKNSLESKVNQLLEGLDEENTKGIREASSKIQNLILNARMPDEVERSIKDAYRGLSIGREVSKLGGIALELVKTGRDAWVAVRSSATAEDMAGASFAGQMRTILNVKGDSQLLLNIKKCWASLYTARAMFYRMHHKITKVSMGVVVQKQLDSDRSGVMFSVDPTTNDHTKILIEASFGLGEAVVSGQVTPDNYLVEKDTGKVINVIVARKLWITNVDRIAGETTRNKMPSEKIMQRVLTDSQIKKLAELAVKLEEHYGKPQDIEWAEERGRLFLVQTRPITTLTTEPKAPAEVHKISGKPLVSGLKASPGHAKGIVKIVKSLDELEKVEKGDVLVAKMTNPDMVPYMKKSVAIVTEEGGATSHAAIVSRELGIPCIVGTGDAMTKLQDGQEIIVDANSGNVYLAGQAPEVDAEISNENGEEVPSEIAVSVPVGDGITATSIKVNIAFPETASKHASKTDGVGLVRAEHMLTEAGMHPVYMARSNPEQLIGVIEKALEMIARAFHPKPVWYRTLDARTDEFRHLQGGEGEPQEANPMLGWHGIRRSIEQQEVFRCELEAIKRLKEKGLNNIGIMLPFICSLDEFRKARSLLTFDAPLGIMVETPAATMQMEAFCREGIAFASIGTNDLTQLSLGVDRNSTHLAKIYNEANPGVLALMQQAISACKKAGVEISVCGESASNPSMATKFVEMGIDSLSVEGDAIDAVRAAVARTERKLLLDKARGF